MSTAKRTLIIAALVTALLVVGLGILWSSLSTTRDSALEFAEDLVSAVSRNWEADELYRRASPGYKARHPRADIERDMAVCATRLGQSQSFELRRWEVRSERQTREGLDITDWAGIELLVVFEKDTKPVVMSVVRTDDGWLVDNFGVKLSEGGDSATGGMP